MPHTLEELEAEYAPRSVCVTAYVPKFCFHVQRKLQLPYLDWADVRVGDSLEFWPKEDGVTVISRYWRLVGLADDPMLYISLCDKPGAHH